MSVRVLIVDDLEPFRGAARTLIAATPGFEVAGEVASGEESLEMARAVHPDLVLMDVNLPGMGGVEAGRRIKADAPATIVVLVSTRDRDDAGSLIAHSGAAAYIAKARLNPASLRAAWQAATEGGE
jgi:DNA-binding NarL/FixJ family response regulator